MLRGLYRNSILLRGIKKGRSKLTRRSPLRISPSFSPLLSSSSQYGRSFGLNHYLTRRSSSDKINELRYSPSHSYLDRTTPSSTNTDVNSTIPRDEAIISKYRRFSNHEDEDEDIVDEASLLTEHSDVDVVDILCEIANSYALMYQYRMLAHKFQLDAGTISLPIDLVLRTEEVIHNKSLDAVQGLLEYIQGLAAVASHGKHFLLHPLEELEGTLLEVFEESEDKNDLGLQSERDDLRVLIFYLESGRKILQESQAPLPIRLRKDLCASMKMLILSENHSSGPILGLKKYIESLLLMPQESTIGTPMRFVTDSILNACYCPMPDRQEIPNFANVDRYLTRGAKPSSDGFLWLFRKEIFAVLDMRGQDALPEAIDVKYENIPIEPDEMPTLNQINAFVELVNGYRRRRKVIMVHCSDGIGRTGVMVACLRVARGMPVQEALSYENFLDYPNGEEYEIMVRSYAQLLEGDQEHLGPNGIFEPIFDEPLSDFIREVSSTKFSENTSRYTSQKSSCPHSCRSSECRSEKSSVHMPRGCLPFLRGIAPRRKR